MSPRPVRDADRLILVLVPAHLELTHRGPRSTEVPITADQLPSRPRAEVTVGYPRRQGDRFGTERRHHDARRRNWQRPQARVLDGVVAAVMVERAAHPQAPDDLYRLLEHLMADLDGGPPVSEDVIVERLAAPDTE